MTPERNNATPLILKQQFFYNKHTYKYTHKYTTTADKLIPN